MGTGTLTSRSTGETITSAFFNDFNSALNETFVGRNSSGAATSGQSLGTSAIPWGSGYFNSLIIDGSALDTSQITSPANRIVSGATRASSNQPNFITANGSALSLTINGNTTNLVYDVNGTAVTCSTQITVSSLTAAPSSNNTCLVNMGDAADQNSTRFWGEPMNQFIRPNSFVDGLTGSVTDSQQPHSETIVVDNMGSEITGLVGKFAAFKINDGSTDEYFIAYVKSTTELSNCFRGCFLGSDSLPINRIKFANNDTITLMKLTWIFLTNDGTTADVTYNPPVWSFDQPGSPTTGDYWYDLSVNQWKRYSGSAFVQINRTLIGIAISDSSNCVASRSQDFFYQYKDTNTVTVRRESATNCKVNNINANVYVYSGNLDFKLYTPTWNITTDLAATGTKDAYATEAASTWYYLYFKDTGDRVMSDIGPVYRSDLLGCYHPHNPWRCVGVAFNNSSSNLEGPAFDGADRVLPDVAYLQDVQSYNTNGGTPGSANNYHTRTLGSVRGNTWFIKDLSSSLFTLIPGTYFIRCGSPMYYCNAHTSRLYNITDSEITIQAQTAYASAAYNGMTRSWLSGMFKIEKDTQFKVQYGANSYYGNVYGLGWATQNSTLGDSIYAMMEIVKLR